MENYHRNRREIQGIVNVIVSPMKWWPWFSGACRGRSSALRVQRVRMIKCGILLFKFHVIFKLYLGVAAVACWNWKLGRFDLESQTDTRNGMDFEFLTDSFKRHGYPHNVSLFVEIWSDGLRLSMRQLMLCSRNFCRMWGATLQLA